MTYDSYEAAKIANPDKEILKARNDWSGIKSYIGKFIASNPGEDGGVPFIGKNAFEECNPADYCMTVEKFLADNERLPIGSMILHTDNSFNLIDSDGMGDICSTDLESFVLKSPESHKVKPRDNDYAMSVMEKKVKTEYVKVEFIKLSDAAIAVDAGDIQFNKFGDQPIDSKALALHYCNNGTLSFYRRIEKEIDERQEFIDAMFEVTGKSNSPTTTGYFGDLYDSGKFKLVEGE